ncbi:hypothetical protein FI667_g3266, partial [Globisporangium splendens]
MNVSPKSNSFFKYQAQTNSRRKSNAAAAHDVARRERAGAGGSALPRARARAYRGVQAVLDEMVYDVEICAHEGEVATLKRELTAATSALAEHQQRERDLVQERQQAYDYAAQMELRGKQTAAKFQENIAVVLLELAKKEIIEQELVQARQQNLLTAQLSKELANAQREIRELHRKNSIQTLLKRNGLAAGGKAVGARAVQSGGAWEHQHRGLIPVSPSSSSTSSQSSVTSSPPTTSNNQLMVSSQPNEYLVRCPGKLLMHIFAFLDANSVFAVGLTNHSLLARVHVMFGMETALGNSGGGRQRKPSPVKQNQSSPKPRSQQIKGRSQSFMNPSEKEKAQLSKAEMIVKSLKKDEIKLFHEMSTRMKALETHLGQVQAEKEDIAARLHGAENVRDFLMDKLKDLEDRLSSIMETSSKKDEQAALDREIIGFLDAKTQEYETTLKKCAKQNEEYRTELTRLHEEHSAKMTIIQDMVELLTHEKQDLELQLRSQRKVLVREVKVLRAQNQQLVTEKEQYFTQLKQLKRALHHLDELT